MINTDIYRGCFISLKFGKNGFQKINLNFDMTLPSQY